MELNIRGVMETDDGNRIAPMASGIGVLRTGEPVLDLSEKDTDYAVWRFAPAREIDRVLNLARNASRSAEQAGEPEKRALRYCAEPATKTSVADEDRRLVTDRLKSQQGGCSRVTTHAASSQKHSGPSPSGAPAIPQCPAHDLTNPNSVVVVVGPAVLVVVGATVVVVVGGTVVLVVVVVVVVLVDVVDVVVVVPWTHWLFTQLLPGVAVAALDRHSAAVSGLAALCILGSAILRRAAHAEAVLGVEPDDVLLWQLLCTWHRSPSRFPPAADTSGNATTMINVSNPKNAAFMCEKTSADLARITGPQ